MIRMMKYTILLAFPLNREGQCLVNRDDSAELSISAATLPTPGVRAPSRMPRLHVTYSFLHTTYTHTNTPRSKILPCLS